MSDETREMEPVAERPGIVAGYGISTAAEGMLAWAWASEQMAASRNYWLATVRRDGRAHVAPIWGVWRDAALWFGTDAVSVKGRNLAASTEVTVHLESGDVVVIIEGAVESVAAPAVVDDAYAAKYDGVRLSAAPGEALIYRLRPRIALGWLEKDYPNTATRWRFV